VKEHSLTYTFTLFVFHALPSLQILSSWQ